jgi:metal-sulfur cluster biosynthetic enzyme
MSKNDFRRLKASCLAVLAIGVLALTALAMPKHSASACVTPAVVQGLTGTVTGSGRITINGQIAQDGARITNGSVIDTDADADALVDLGILGQIIMRPNTTIKVTLAQNSCQVTMERCGSITQTVPRGVANEVQLDLPKQAQVISHQGNLWVSVGDSQNNSRKQLASGKHKTFPQAKAFIVDGNGKGDTVFTVNCCQCCFIDKINP